MPPNIMILKKFFHHVYIHKRQNRLRLLVIRNSNCKQGIRGEGLPWWVVTGIMEVMPACSTGMLIITLLMRT